MLHLASRRFSCLLINRKHRWLNILLILDTHQLTIHSLAAYLPEDRISTLRYAPYFNLMIISFANIFKKVTFQANQLSMQANSCIVVAAPITAKFFKMDFMGAFHKNQYTWHSA